jgi:CdiI immunity protein
MGELYQHLFQFLAGYFHQDWRSDHADVPSAVQSFVDAAVEENVRKTVDELAEFMEQTRGFSTVDLENILVSGFYFSVGGNPRRVLKGILRRLEPAIQNKWGQTPS